MDRYLAHQTFVFMTAILLIFPQLSQAQIPGVPCICETSSLELKPMIKSPRIILINNPENTRTTWTYEPIDTFAVTPKKPVPEITKVPIVDESETRINRSDISRKRKNKGKIRLRKRSYKKYRGQCPVFN